MIADLHCHYPMHLLADDASPSDTYDRIVRVRRRPRWLDRLRAVVLRIAARGFNYRDHASGWRVTFDGLERGHTGLVCSVLFEPFAEIDLDELPQSDPEDGYFADLIEHLDRVEAELERIDPLAPAISSSGPRPTSRPRRQPAAWRSSTASRAAFTWGARRTRSPPTWRSWRGAASAT